MTTDAIEQEWMDLIKSLQDENDRLRLQYDVIHRQNKQLLEQIKRVEWNGWTMMPEGARLDACPECRYRETEGHAGGCRLHAMVVKHDRDKQ